MTRFARFVGWSCCGVVTSVLLTIVASPPGQTSTSELITNRASPYLSAEVAQSADDLTMPATESVDIPVLPSLETSPSAAPPVPAAPTVPAPAAPAVESPAIQPIENHEQPQAPRRDRPQLSIPSRSLPSRSQDPADQIAPPGLNVQRGSQPISPFMAIAMQKELDNLVGRFESAVFLASAVDQPVEVQVPSLDELLAASEITDISLAAEPEIHPALVEARQLIQDWTGLIDNQAYQEARDRWLSARQKIWDNFPIDRSFAQPEIRSMWLDRGTIVRAGSREGLAILFDFLQEAGINTIFLETINSSYPIYPSRVAPTQNPLTRRWDPLGAAVELAHERNMELHA